MTDLKNWFRENILPWIKKHPKQSACVAAACAVGLGLGFGSAMIINGIIVGAVSAGAAGVLLWKLSHSKSSLARRTYNVIARYPLAADIGVTGLAFMAAGSGITAILAAGSAALLASVVLIDLPEVPIEVNDRLLTAA
jgi:hypothetical protein